MNNSQNLGSFLELLSPTLGGVKYIFPLPKEGAKERLQRRLQFINTNNLYKNDAGFVSTNLPNKQLNIVSRNDYFSNNTGLNFGKVINYTTSFFTQFAQLQKVAPRFDRFTLECENCEWAFNIVYSKNCYLTSATWSSENCLYSERIGESKNIFDSLIVKNSENCYELIDAQNCFEVFFSERVQECRQSAYLYNCKNVEYCLGCVGIDGKKYWILNTESTQEQYELVKKEIFSSKTKLDQFLEKYFQLKKTLQKAGYDGFGNISTSGIGVYNSKNITHGYFVQKSEDCINIEFGEDYKNCFDCSHGDSIEKCYQTVASYKLFNCHFCFNVVECVDCLYSETLTNCKNCFFCVGLVDAEYCIFNKQYSKDEYFEHVAKIIQTMKQSGEWGMFFHDDNCLFEYNLSRAQKIFPLEKSEAISHGFTWADYIAPFPKVEKTISGNLLPYNISDIPDDVMNWAIECENTKRPFMIVKEELDFHRKYHLPLPRLHKETRLEERYKKIYLLEPPTF